MWIISPGPSGYRVPPENARAPATRAVEHFAAHKQGPCAALYEHDIDDVIMYLGDSVRVPMNESEAVGSGGVAVVGQSLAGRVVPAHPGREGRIPLFQLRSFPHGESRRVELKYRRVGKDNSLAYECWDPYEHVRNVPPFRNQVAVRGVGRNVDYIAGAQWIPKSTRNARAPDACAVEHFAAHKQSPFPALYEHDVEAVLMYLRESVCVPINESEAVGSGGVAVVDQSLAGGVVLAHPG